MLFRRFLIDHVVSKAPWPYVNCAEDWYFRRVMDQRIRSSTAAMAKGKKGKGKGKGFRVKRNKGQKRKQWWAQQQAERAARAAAGPRTPPGPPPGHVPRTPVTPSACAQSEAEEEASDDGEPLIVETPGFCQ